MRSITRFLLGSLPVTVSAAVVLTLGALTALPAAANQEETMLVITVQPTTTQVNTAMTPAVATVTDKLPSKNRVVDRIIASSSATSVPSKRASRVLQGYEIKLAPPG